MKQILPTIITVMALMLPTAAQAAGYSRMHQTPEPDTKEKMQARLAEVKLPSDSIEVLFNIYDLSSESEADSVGRIIYNTAVAHGYHADALDIIRDIAQRHEEDSTVLVMLRDELKRFPPSDLQKETLVFVKIYLSYVQMGLTPETELKEKVVRFINRYDSNLEDPYERLMQQFRQCIFISQETQGELLTQYLERLEHQLQSMPTQSDKLTARLYRQKAYSYTINDEPRLAVEADRKLMEIYDRSEQTSALQGRPYRNMDYMRYNSLRRMLRNYRALTPDEADSIYTQIEHLAAENPSIARQLQKNPRPRAYMNMAKGNYEEAIMPLYKLSIKGDVEDHMDQRQMLKALITAAQATGHKQILLEASIEYAKQMQTYMDSKLSEIIRELQIIYDVEDLQNDSVATELAYQMSVGERHSTIINIVIWIAVGLLVILAVLYMLLRRYHTLSHKLSDSNARLLKRHQELVEGTNELRAAIDEARKAENDKSVFIRYISSTLLLPLQSMMEYSRRIINAAGSDAKPFLNRFSGIMDENSEALRRIADRLRTLSHEEDNNNISS
ncbi:MAG: hypothetical protein K2M97_04975 [Muribaculaceae bacterium]|nr:hypothetical protein [Muribaculaceae bacterium]